MAYTAPLDDILFTLEHVAGLADARAAGAVDNLAADDAQAILSEAARFAEEVLAPLNQSGDRAGTTLRDGRVATAPGFAEAYGGFVDGGWGGLIGSEAYGGQALPMALHVALTDLWNQANPAFAINPLLTACAVEALERHGSEALKATYLAKLVSGEWTGTMNLTEPQSGSDLSGLRTRAEPDGERYRLFGQKIFITYGDHDLTDNIVHMVLARLPDAPEGTRGISLFLVPRRLVEDDGSLGADNDVACVGVEHKLGINASPTCTMAYGARGEGALGWLVGEPNKGLAAMFTMMNQARVGVATQGAAVAERATQRAVACARERRQGRDAAGETVPIIAHPDVRRMLMTMRALTAAARSLCYATAVAIDRGRRGEGAAAWRARADLLTPVAKAFATDVGVEVASLGIQVHGGMGFIEETGAAQHFRDARIFPIYEGTNGIQAIDLVRRKIGLDDGAVLAAFLAELRAVADAARGANALSLGRAAQRLDAAIEAVASTAAALRADISGGEAERALAAATPFLRALALTAGGGFLMTAALKADGTAPAHAGLARFFAEEFVAGVPALAAGALESAADVLAADFSAA